MLAAQEDTIRDVVAVFLDDHQCLQAMPENGLRILSLLQNPNFSTRQLVKLIEQDAAIAARVIQTVNSAAYARSNRITQLDRATVYLGMSTVKEIVVATTVQTICKPVVIGNYSMHDLWDHSLGVAVLCREFALRSKHIDPELAFLAGILHDVGLLLSAQSETGTSAEIFADAEDRSAPFTKVEKSYFGFDHCELGNRLAGGWNFPPEIAAAIQWHHAPRQAPATFQSLCTLVHVADVLCAQSGFGFPLTITNSTIDNQTLSQISLTRNEMKDVMNRFRVLLRLHQN